MFKKIFSILALFSLIFTPFIFASADIFPGSFNETEGLVPCGKGTSPSNACTLCHLIIGIQNIVNFGLYLLITIAAVGIVIAGVMYIVSSGNEEMVSKAKSFLKASLTGFTITLMGWFLVNITMWALAKNHVLNLAGGKIWTDFTCNTTSTAASATSSATETGSVYTGPITEGNLSDAEARAQLNALGILVNAEEPQTSLNGIPASVIASLGQIKSMCGDILVTGGTEGKPHVSHGPGKAVVDLRWNESVASCMKTNASTLGITKMCVAAEDQEYTYNCNYIEGNQHIHVAF